MFHVHTGRSPLWGSFFLHEWNTWMQLHAPSGSGEWRGTLSWCFTPLSDLSRRGVKQLTATLYLFSQGHQLPGLGSGQGALLCCFVCSAPRRWEWNTGAVVHCPLPVPQTEGPWLGRHGVVFPRPPWSEGCEGATALHAFTRLGSPWFGEQGQLQAAFLYCILPWKDF